MMDRRTLLRSFAAAATTLALAPAAAVGKLAGLNPAAAVGLKFRTIETWTMIYSVPGYDNKLKVDYGWVVTPFEQLAKGDVFRSTDEPDDAEKVGAGRTEYTVNGDAEPCEPKGNFKVDCTRLTHEFRRRLSFGLAT